MLASTCISSRLDQMRISVAAGQRGRIELDSRNGGNWTLTTALVAMPRSASMSSFAESPSWVIQDLGATS